MGFEDVNRVIDKVSANLEKAKPNQQLLGEIAQYLMVSNVSRIHDKGRNVSGGLIGQYSTRPMLIGAKSFRKKNTARSVFGSKNKRKKLQWRKVKGRNLAILPGGYKQLRKLDGDRYNFVNLKRTTKLRDDFRVLRRGKIWKLGFGKYGADLSKYLEDKYGKVWGVTDKDSNIIEQIIANHINRAF